jgi:glycerol-3-phosphate acyltransferase PlsX
MKIALDLMGGDYAPQELLAGALNWLNNNDGQVILVGKEDIITSELGNYNYDSQRIEILNAGQVIAMNESPAAALRKKKDASIIVATKLVKEGKQML